MLARLALAAIAGAALGYWLRHRQEPDIDWDNAGEPLTMLDCISDLIESGELIFGRDDTMILQEIIPQCTCGRHCDG